MVKNSLLYIAFLLVFSQCSTLNSDYTAQQIVDKALEAHGSEVLENGTLSFDFRDRSYKATRKSGIFSLHRILKDSVIIEDILSNDGFVRKINDVSVQLADSMAFKYSESVNSVHYFAALPYGLNDAAVIKKRLADVVFKGKSYYTIQVTFTQEGGGVDYEDVFMYWFSKDNFQLDYLAYKFHVNGGGVRFREVVDNKLVNGILLNNYNNYKPNDTLTTIYTIDKAFQEGRLKKLSEIRLQNSSFTALY